MDERSESVLQTRPARLRCKTLEGRTVGGIFILKASLIHICFSFPTSYTHECQQESLFVDL